MKAYHIKTNEPDSHDALGFERFDLDSIYVPEKAILLGFIDWENSKGLLKNYGGGNSSYTPKAEDIINGNRNNVQGKVVSTFDLDEETAEKIIKVSEGVQHGPHHHKEIKITEKFDNSTDGLIRILSGESIKKKRMCLGYGDV